MRLKFSVITLFPDLIESYCTTSIMGRAQAAGITQIETVNPRDFTTDVHHKVDDAPYGGGPGMVMMCKPVIEAWHSLAPLPQNTRVLLMSPVGVQFNQAMAQDLSEAEQIVILCGHYEGIDARIEDLIPNLQPVCTGDYVLTGGELPALTVIDAVTRLLPGALGKDHSSVDESFSEGLLEYPQYTRPAEFEGLSVPDVLLSGNHAKIAKWRKQMSEARTRQYRPDLYERYQNPVG